MGRVGITKTALLIFIFPFGMFLSIELSWASSTYVSDSIEINLHESPNKESKVIAVLTSGEPVETIVSDEDWSFVRLTEQGDGNTRGFILSRYLMTREPWKTKALPLKDENEVLNSKLVQAEVELKAVSREDDVLSQKLKTSERTLRELQSTYDTLRSNKREFLTLQASNDGTVAQLEVLQEKARRLREENSGLRTFTWKKFFIAEGLVLLCGLMIGLAVGRLEKKSKSLMYY